MEDLIEKLKNIKVPTSKKPFSLLEMMYKHVHSKELVQSEMFAGLLRRSLELAESFLSRIEINVDLHEVSDFKIETERNANGRRIDIFISWSDGDKKHAVIIENKLNSAQNQPNQLNDYYDAIISEGYEVDKIVYMPLSKNWQKSEYTDARKDVLAKTINFEAQDIVDWLFSTIGEVAEAIIKGEFTLFGYQTDPIWQYWEFLKCLISNQYIMQQVIEIQEKLSLEEIEKLEKLAEFTRTEEWRKARFRPIVEQINNKGNFAKELLVKYKQDKVNYADFYFDNWQNTFWYSVWLYPNDGIYLYKYEGYDNCTEIEKFETSETEKLVEYITPLLEELSKL